MTPPLPADLAVPLEHVSARCGFRIVWHASIGSTNDAATRLADAGEPAGLVVVADAQTAGRGRLGRPWASPPGAGIYASVLLRPEPAAARLLTLAAGVALTEGIEAATGLAAAIKWPNDLIVPGGVGATDWRKLAGILAEGGVASAGAPWVVVGFGINVQPAAYPAEIAARATSLEAELGRPVERGLVLAECLAALARRHDDLRHGRTRDVLDAWRRRAASTLGRRVAWDEDGRERQGTVRGIDDAGALVVSHASGDVRVVAGEVRWI
jgi:BirA family biotin operon repressor/biotin-[acetyl-CoA-carboxylase] ligase